MASRCEVCRKGTMVGRHIRHKASGNWQYRAHKISRVFKANVRAATIMREGRPTRVKICTRCLRTISKTDDL